MILYHGTSTDIKDIDLNKSKDFTDFGKGFYTTDIKEQAESWAKVKAKRTKNDALIIKYRLLKDENLSTKLFKSVNKEWLDFISDNRINGISHKYDMVIGPVADDKVIQTVQLYIEGVLDEQTALHMLKYIKPNNQISFHTDKSISLLEKVGVINVI